MKILGIESSHDDTSIGLVDNHKVIFNYKISQTEIHKEYGGTVPEIASREHFQNFYILMEKVLKSKVDLTSIDAIAYTKEPGLIGALQMGELFANALSQMLNKPLIPINHLGGHLFSVLLDQDCKIQYPAIGVIVSGGHSNLYYMEDQNTKKIIGQTQDDAIGEVFDKVARVLNLGFPGGPIIDQIFAKQDFKKMSEYKLTTPKIKNKYDLSFSGYKTQIINIIKKDENINHELLAAAFEKNVIDYLISKIREAIEEFKPKTLILSGGVSANKYLRQEFSKLHKNVLIPLMEYTTDNGAMIASAAMINKTRI